MKKIRAPCRSPNGRGSGRRGSMRGSARLGATLVSFTVAASSDVSFAPVSFVAFADAFPSDLPTMRRRPEGDIKNVWGPRRALRLIRGQGADNGGLAKLRPLPEEQAQAA